MSVSLRRFQISAFLMNCLRIKVKSSFPPKKSKAPKFLQSVSLPYRICIHAIKGSHVWSNDNSVSGAYFSTKNNR